MIKLNTAISFLNAGGEMGRFTREYDWEATSVGKPESWPHSLKTIVSVILNSRFPMFLWWGSDLIQFYNDAYRPSLGDTGKHPAALGQKGEECWPEIWPVIKPLIDQVLSQGESTWSEDQLIPIFRNGKLEDVYWTFSYSPVINDSGNISGVLVVCNETTEKITSIKKLQESELFVRKAFNNAVSAQAVWTGEDMIISLANEQMMKIWGRDNSVIGKPLMVAIPELLETDALLRLRHVLHTGETYYQPEEKFNLLRHGKFTRDITIIHTRRYRMLKEKTLVYCIQEQILQSRYWPGKKYKKMNYVSRALLSRLQFLCVYILAKKCE